MATKPENLRAGIPYTLSVASPVAGEVYLLSFEMTAMYPVRFLGVDGQFDRRQILKYEWLAGPLAGQTGRSYSVNFWREPRTRADWREIAATLTSWEWTKLAAGGYPGRTLAQFRRRGVVPEICEQNSCNQ